MGKAEGQVTFFPSVFSDFPGLSRVLIHRRVRKPTDGTVLFLEEPSLFGGQRWDARMLGKLCTSGKFLPMQKHKQSLTMEKAPWPFICPWPKALCKAGMFVHSHGTLLTGKRRQNHPANQVSVTKVPIPIREHFSPRSLCGRLRQTGPLGAVPVPS